MFLALYIESKGKRTDKTFFLRDINLGHIAYGPNNSDTWHLLVKTMLDQLVPEPWHVVNVGGGNWQRLVGEVNAWVVERMDHTVEEIVRKVELHFISSVEVGAETNIICSIKLNGIILKSHIKWDLNVIILLDDKVV